MNRHEIIQSDVSLNQALSMSDVVITGVPSSGYKLAATHMKDGVIAINFSTFKNMGDDVKEKSSIFVPSVGKVTICMLQRNLLRLCSYLLRSSK